MDAIESKLAQTTSPSSPDLLGAAMFVVDSKAQGDVLYEHFSGRRRLDSNDLLDRSTRLVLGSAGKFITAIAALQLVERNLLVLDEPIYHLLPELRGLPILTPSTTPNKPNQPTFLLQTHTRPLTARHLLVHSSGISNLDEPLIQSWRAAFPAPELDDHTPGVIRKLLTPLLFEPGQGCSYGNSVYFLEVAIARAARCSFKEFVHTNVFDVLDLEGAGWTPMEEAMIERKFLQGVEKGKSGEGLLALENGWAHGLVCNVGDMIHILGDLLSNDSKLLTDEKVRGEFFHPAFEKGSLAWEGLREDKENYIAPIGLAKERSIIPSVNYSAGGLVIEENMASSPFPAGTVTWNGMPNVIWALNREKRLGTFFATQLLPVDDETTVDLAMEFFRAAWEIFG